ncbi:CBS domain-containing protein [uncultured Psychromonas sp.]|uniref:CBS domain-containing protein n=1 Tax=uncultured Psychromonas sp. TaxID=173974 RepID=UPI00261A5403|nr:CBS domain-containing protein [uncultured Psychromonas sp.]
MSQQTVKQIMRKQPITIQCKTPLTEIIHIIVTSQQAQLPVVNNNKKLIGMVSLIDCQKALLIGAYHCDKPVTVNDVMKEEFMFLNEDEDLSEVAINTQQQIENFFPVVKDDKLIAILRRTDLLVHLHKNLSLCSKTQ